MPLDDRSNASPCKTDVSFDKNVSENISIAKGSKAKEYSYMVEDCSGTEPTPKNHTMLSKNQVIFSNTLFKTEASPKRTLVH